MLLPFHSSSHGSRSPASLSITTCGRPPTDTSSRWVVPPFPTSPYSNIEFVHAFPKTSPLSPAAKRKERARVTRELRLGGKDVPEPWPAWYPHFLAPGWPERAMQNFTSSSQGSHCWRNSGVLLPVVLWLSWQPGDLPNPLFCFKKRLKAAEAESKLKQVYIPN